MCEAEKAVIRSGMRLAGCVGFVAFLSACATSHFVGTRMSSDPNTAGYNQPYKVQGRWYAPKQQPNYDMVGLASWYSYESHGHTTADGERLDARLLTAAHRTLPIPSYLEVTNLENGRRIQVRLNDRGPFVAGRILDVSRGAAEKLGFVLHGVTEVRVRYVGPAPPV